MSHTHSGRVSAGLTMLALGAMICGWMPIAGAQTTSAAPFRFEAHAVPVDSRVQETLQTRFHIEGMSRFVISVGGSLTYAMNVARYRDDENAPRRAIVYLPEDGAEIALLSGPDPNRVRLDAWNDLRRVVMKTYRRGGSVRSAGGTTCSGSIS